MTIDIILPAEVTTEMLRLSKQLDSDHEALIVASRRWALAEAAYRKARAIAYLGYETGTIPEREARVDLATESERFDAHHWEALKVANLERVRSTRAQLSATQSVANALKSEMDMAGRL